MRNYGFVKISKIICLTILLSIGLKPGLLICKSYKNPFLSTIFAKKNTSKTGKYLSSLTNSCKKYIKNAKNINFKTIKKFLSSKYVFIPIIGCSSIVIIALLNNIFGDKKNDKNSDTEKDPERKAQLERERLERERLAQLERDKQAQLERDRLERDRQAQLERERQAQLEQDRLERDRQAQLERERQAQLERERQAQLERDRLERDRQAQLERDRLERERLEKEKTKPVRPIKTKDTKANQKEQLRKRRADEKAKKTGVKVLPAITNLQKPESAKNAKPKKSSITANERLYLMARKKQAANQPAIEKQPANKKSEKTKTTKSVAKNNKGA